MDAKARFVTQNRARLIQDVSTVLAIADSLGTFVHPEIYGDIHAEKTSRGQMRILYVKLLDSGGPVVKAAFYEALKEHQPHLLEDHDFQAAASPSNLVPGGPVVKAAFYKQHQPHLLEDHDPVPPSYADPVCPSQASAPAADLHPESDDFQAAASPSNLVPCGPVIKAARDDGIGSRTRNMLNPLINWIDNIYEPSAPAADLHPESDASATRFVDKHRRLLIGKVKKVKPILDLLLEKKVITQKAHADLSKHTGQDTMRELYDHLKSNPSKEMFYQALEIHEKTLVDNIDVEAKELLKNNRFMIWSLVFAILGTTLLWSTMFVAVIAVVGPRNTPPFNFVLLATLVGCLTCSCGLVVAFRSLPEFYQVPRSSYTAKIFFILCCKPWPLKSPKAAGRLFLVSSCFTFLVILSWTVAGVVMNDLNGFVPFQPVFWFSVLVTLIAGILYIRAYGKLPCCCCSKGTGQKPGALLTSRMGELGGEEELEVICVNDPGELVASP